MKTRIATSFAAALLMAGPSVASARPVGHTAPSADIAALEAASDSLFAAWRDKKPEAILSHFADDAVAMESFAPAMNGKAAMAEYVNGIVHDPNFSLRMTRLKTDVSKSGDLGYVRGTYDLAYTDPRSKALTKAAGHFIAILKKRADGSWKAVEDISAYGTR